MDIVHGVAESDTTEQMSTQSVYLIPSQISNIYGKAITHTHPTLTCEIKFCSNSLACFS